MIRLRQTFGAHTGRVVEHSKDVVTFGRLPTCDVAFDPQADLDASGRHAEVRREADGWHLLDTGSRNGTYLNGQKIERARLSSGDEIEFGLGGPRMQVEIGEALGPPPPGTPLHTGPMTPARPNQATEAATAVPHVGAALPPTPRVPADASPPAYHTPVPMSAPPSSFQPPSDAPVMQYAHGPQSGMPASPGASSSGAGGFGPMSVPGGSHGGVVSPSHSSPGPPSTAAAGEPKRYGQKTVGMMIQAAVQQAQVEAGTGGNRSTAFIRAVASEAATHSSRGLKIAVVVLSILFVLSLTAVVVLLALNWKKTDETRRETDRIAEELEHGARGPQIAERNGGAIYLLVERNDAGERGLCSAFAVRPDLLATTAHCVVAMEERRATGSSFSAAPNGTPGSRLPVVQMWRHPHYVHAQQRPSADVGLVQINGTMPLQVEIATPDRLSQLSSGAEVYVLGYPEGLSNAAAPIAVMTQGVIGRITAFDGSPGDGNTTQLIQHSAIAAGGTSGSPIFDRDGLVVGVNAGRLSGTTGQAVVSPSGSGANAAEEGYRYGVRSDALSSLIAGLGR